MKLTYGGAENYLWMGVGRGETSSFLVSLTIVEAVFAKKNRSRANIPFLGALEASYFELPSSNFAKLAATKRSS